MGKWSFPDSTAPDLIAEWLLLRLGSLFGVDLVWVRLGAIPLRWCSCSIGRDRKVISVEAVDDTQSSLGRSCHVVRVRASRPLRPVELYTGAMILAAVGLGAAAPVGAALLMYRHGAIHDGTAVGASVVLAVLAVLCALTAATGLAVLARRRRPPSVREPGDDRGTLRDPGLLPKLRLPAHIVPSR